jgi:hypothetical protein
VVAKCMKPEGFFAKQPNPRLRDTSAVGRGEESKAGQVLIYPMSQRSAFTHSIASRAVLVYKQGFKARVNTAT